MRRDRACASISSSERARIYHLRCVCVFLLFVFGRGGNVACLSRAFVRLSGGASARARGNTADARVIVLGQAIRNVANANSCELIAASVWIFEALVYQFDLFMQSQRRVMNTK